MEENKDYEENEIEYEPGTWRRKSRKILSTMAIELGVLLIGASILLVVHNMREASEAGAAASEYTNILNERINENMKESAEQAAVNEEYSDMMLNVDDRKIRGMPTEEIDGNQYIGQLEAPSVNVSLPVMYNWNYEQLKKAPCRYYGSYYTDDLVICGHNYRTHFSPLRSIKPGEDVYFITVTGERIHYLVSNIETLKPTAIEEMTENRNNSESASEWDLTLFTCTTGGRARYAIRCDRADEK